MNLYQIFYDIDRLLTMHNLQYWLIAGSFLGAIRNGGIVPGDNDVDIAIQYKDRKRLEGLEKWINKCGYQITRSSHGYRIGRKNLYIDIYTMKKNGEKIEPSQKRVRDKKPQEYFLEKNLFPLKRIAFGGFLAFVPKKYKPYFLRKYGRNWMQTKIRGTKYVTTKPARPFKIKQRKCLPELRSQLPGSSPLNRFFSRIFVINLHDYRDRLKNIHKRMKQKGISYTLFDAIDGRCKTDLECDRKRKALQSEYGVKITTNVDLPPLSLTLGTWYLLKQQIKHKWPAIAIFEDDATFVKNLDKRFVEGIDELNHVAPNWDLLYLGCAQYCGVKGISKKKTSRNKHLSSIYKFNKNANFYVAHKDDIRSPCDPEECTVLSKNLSVAEEASGGYGYGVSLKGARKILRYMKNNINDHMDRILPDMVVYGKLYAVAFDPPIVHHYGGADRPDTSLEWVWE